MAEVEVMANQKYLVAGTNCWTIAAAARIAVLIDSAAYFRALKAALAAARREILIVGWDFDSNVLLEPQNGHDQPLGRWLHRLVDQRPELEIRLLIWRNSLFYGSNEEPVVSLGKRWWDHPRISFRRDGHHPVAACHHQKLVCIDRGLAFAGGMDITLRRWDDGNHAYDNVVRLDKQGNGVQPIHDVQIMFDGPAAVHIADLIAARWTAATGKPVAAVSMLPVWPDSVRPMIQRHPVAIARTMPPYRGNRGIAEIAALNLDLLKAARRSIYIETQYFTIPEVADILVHQLTRRYGPEVIIVTNAQWQGLAERYAMGGNSERILRRLLRADRDGRLGLFYPVTGGNMRIKVHSKLIIVDDLLIRIGSSNLDRRSLGVDTECDVAIEATTDDARAAIIDIRSRLIAEHVGAEPRAFAAMAQHSGSVLAALRHFNGDTERRLEVIRVPWHGETRLVAGSSLIDPRQPFTLRGLLLRDEVVDRT